MEWKKHFDRTVDKDSFDDVNWINEMAQKRASSYGIEGVNYSLTLGVIKNVIPAISSTNSLIASSSVLECVKYLSGCSKLLDNNWLYMGHEGLYSNTDCYQKKQNCHVCSNRIHYRKVNKNMTLNEFYK
jgi:ubiquitin-activating enzyme E1 C